MVERTDARFSRRSVGPVLSDVTAAEVVSAPEPIRGLHQEILTSAGTVLPVTADVLALVAKYEAKGILAARFRPDMQHIALATIAAVDVLVSWNFKHIVRLENPSLQSGQRRIWTSGSEHSLSERGHHV